MSPPAALRQLVQTMGSSWRRESAPDEWRFYIQSQMNGDFSNKNGGKQSFNAPFSASHLEKTRISASDFANQSRTNEKPPVVRRGNPKRIQNRQGFHCGNSKRMQNRRASSPCLPRHPSRTLPTNEWRKLARYSAGSLPQTHADPPFVLKRKKTAGHSDRQDGGTHGDPPIIRSERQDECTRIRHSFSNERKPPVVEKHAGSRRPTPDRPREAHGAALAITKRTNTCQSLAIGQSAGCIAAVRHRSKWRAAA